MPLTRDRITPAARVSLLTFVAFFAAIGLNYLITPPPLLANSPALAYGNALMPLPAWGVVFLICSALILIAFARHDRQLCAYALWVGIVALIVWGVVFAAAALVAGASPGAPAWPWTIAGLCYSLTISLRTRGA